MTVSPHPPDWVQDTVFYQIFPDRFRRGEPAGDSGPVLPWGDPPTAQSFFGGNLAGVQEKLPYLLDLGVTGLYFNPIFMASSPHRYNTYDYLRVDPRLGDLESFRRLVAAAHRNGVRLILDGVFNHSGRGFHPFHDVLENGPASAYLDWFHVQGFPLHAYDEAGPPNYSCWWGFRALPKLNTDNPAVRRYLLAVARYWLDQGIDGWRLDVPNEVTDSFWREFRATVKESHPDAYLVGEIWADGQSWLQGDQFDAITHYELRALLLDWLVEAKHRSQTFARRLQAIVDRYRPEVLHAQMNVLGSHDTPRLMTAAHGDLPAVKLLWLFLLTWPGTPCIYYGDEIGMTGGPDPECRACFPWDESRWNLELRGHVQRLIALRRTIPALRRGTTRILFAQSRQNLFAHGRGRGEQAAVVALNAGHVPCTFDIPLDGMDMADGTVLIDCLTGERRTVHAGRLEAVSLPARSGTILTAAAV